MRRVCPGEGPEGILSQAIHLWSLIHGSHELLLQLNHSWMILCWLPLLVLQQQQQEHVSHPVNFLNMAHPNVCQASCIAT
jgi:hypothetical protein